MSNFSKGVPISTSFALSAKVPLDPRLIAQNKEELLTLPDIEKYIGMKVVLLEEKMEVQLDSDGNWVPCHTSYSFGEGMPDDAAGAIGDIYFDTTNNDIYYKIIKDQATLETEWFLIMNIKGDRGEQGVQGLTGFRGSLWYTGEEINGAEAGPKKYPDSGITEARIGDMFLNPSGNFYICTTAGDAETAEWDLGGNIKGPQGIQGLSAFEVAQKTFGTEPPYDTEENWLESLKGLGVPEGIPDRVDTLEDQVTKLFTIDPIVESFNTDTYISDTTISNPTLKWSFNKEASSVKLSYTKTGEKKAEVEVADASVSELAVTGEFDKDTVFEIYYVDTDGKTSNTLTLSISIVTPILYGYGETQEFDSMDDATGKTFIDDTLTSKVLAKSLISPIYIATEDKSSDETNHLYLAIPASVSESPVLSVNGLVGGFSNIKSINYSEEPAIVYNIYQSIYTGYKAFTLKLSEDY